jgi:hypothetical protein
LTLPEAGLRTVGVERKRLLAVVVPDVQNLAVAIADAFAHTNVDQEKQSPPLEHPAGAALLPVFKDDLLMLMALDQVVDAQSCNVTA